MDKKIQKYIITGVATLLAISLLIIGYVSYVNSKFDKAKQLYSEGKYFMAAMEIDNLLYTGNDKYTFDKIKYSRKMGDIYEVYSYTLEDEDYELSIRCLVNGVRQCVGVENDKLSSGERDAFNYFKAIFYNDLNDIFGISAEEAEKLASMELEDRDVKVKELAEKHVASNQIEQNKQDQIIADRNNPVEVRNLEWDNNSSYMVATGDVFNKSDITIKFVELKVAFKDASGNVIDTTSTYAVGSEGLAPGESTKWEAMVKRDEKIESYSVSLIDFN